MGVTMRARWLRVFFEDCGLRGCDPDQVLTRDAVDDLARRYARARRINAREALRDARVALRSWSRMLADRGHVVPMWHSLPPRDPRVEQAVSAWRADGLRESTISECLKWVERFLRDCRRRGRQAEPELTRRDVDRFARRYTRRRDIDVDVAFRNARRSLLAWSRALAYCGHDVPAWLPQRPNRSLPPLLAEFVRYRFDHRGVVASTVEHNLRDVRGFLTFLRSRGRRLRRLRLLDVDGYVAELGGRCARTTVKGACDSIRGFLRFAHATGRLPYDLAPLVIGPRVRSDEKPPRGLPWSDVRKLLKMIDRSTRAGKRDYAILLLMTAYGLGAAEVVGLQLDDLDWAGGRIRIRRRKTHQDLVLPLLPPIGEAVAAYLRSGRLSRTTSRALFLRLRAPLVGLAGSTAIGSIFQARARAAGLRLAVGSHALRHSYATRQVDQGAPLKLVGDILGHRTPDSTSVYVRVALQRMRPLALPVPR